MIRDLLPRMRVGRVGNDNVDRAGDRVVPHGDGEEPLAETLRKNLDQIERRDDVAEKWCFAPGEEAADDVLRRGAGVDQRLEKRHTPRDRCEERLGDHTRSGGLLEQKRLRQIVDRHRDQSTRVEH